MPNRTPIYVIGHRNPDNDSISSAVGYAYLKNELAKQDGTAKSVKYVPARLGPLPPESSWVLERFNQPAPAILKHVNPIVGDAMTEDPITISPDAPMMEAGRQLRKYNIRSLVVEGDDGGFLGLISTRAIAERYISATDMLDEQDPSSSMAVATSLIESLHQKVGELMATNVLVLREDALLKDARVDLMASELREGVVLNDDGTIKGILTRSDITTAPKRQVILVDHNETRQAALGIESANIVEIVDHHRIADVSTSNPIRFLNLPWGSTATIVTSEFRRYGVDIPQDIAGVLLSAIMTDTVVLKSPTATPMDEDQAKYLANILGVDITEFALAVFRAKGGEDDVSIENLVQADSKEFQVGDDVVLIAQHETVDLAAVMQREDEIRAHMQSLCESKGYDFVLLLATDIIKEGSQFLLEGNPRTVEQAFGITCTSPGGNWMPGILSRKKQVAAKILG